MTGDPPSRVTVAVCALTFHRPQGLARLLRAIAELEPPPDSEVRIVVVDNDPDGSAAPIVDGERERLGWPVTYVIEERRGIPFGRNAAVKAAGDVDFVAFIDDDEVPDDDWLTELVAMQRRTGADVVTGPVVPEFEIPPPAWVERGGFFERTRFPDGTEIDWATTSSVLISKRVIPTDAPPFNERMALTGGSDTHFFLRAHLEGRRMVWADRALVTELIPPSRVTVGWLLRRQYRRGNTQTLCMLDLRGSLIRRARKAAQGTLKIVQGIAMLAIAVARGRIGIVRGLQVVCYGAGILAGLAGRRYEEYVTTHGT